MKVFYLFLFLSIFQIASSQNNKRLEALYGILNKVEQGDILKKNEIFLLLESCKDSCLKNNAEFSEWRNDAIFKIINHPSNLQKMLFVLKNKTDLFSFLLEELTFPVYEQDYYICIKNIRNTRGNRNIKKRLITILQQLDSTFKCK